MAHDGPVSRLLNRRLSRPLARLAVRAGLSPNQATALSTGIALAAPLLFVVNRPRLAGFAIQAASVVDGVDGDLARLTNRSTRFGAVLDAVADRYADAAMIAGMTYWSVRHERKPATEADAHHPDSAIGRESLVRGEPHRRLLYRIGQ